MKPFYVFFTALLLIGCAEEDPQELQRKGDEYLAQGELDKAEYYFEQIDSGALNYLVAKRRLEEIRRLRSEAKSARKAELPPEQQISILDHAFEKKSFGKMLVHHFNIYNQNDFDCKNVEIKVVYYSGTKWLDEKQITLDGVIPARTSQAFSNIEGGFINEDVTRCAVKIVSADKVGRRLF